MASSKRAPPGVCLLLYKVMVQLPALFGVCIFFSNTPDMGYTQNYLLG